MSIACLHVRYFSIGLGKRDWWWASRFLWQPADVGIEMPRPGPVRKTENAKSAGVVRVAPLSVGSLLSIGSFVCLNTTPPFFRPPVTPPRETQIFPPGSALLLFFFPPPTHCHGATCSPRITPFPRNSTFGLHIFVSETLYLNWALLLRTVTAACASSCSWAYWPTSALSSTLPPSRWSRPGLAARQPVICSHTLHTRHAFCMEPEARP